MIKNRTTQNIRAASRTIVTEMGKIGKQSVRKLGEIVGRSKSSVSRLLQAKEQRKELHDTLEHLILLTPTLSATAPALLYLLHSCSRPAGEGPVAEVISCAFLSGETCRRGDGGRSQNPRNAANHGD